MDGSSGKLSADVGEADEWAPETGLWRCCREMGTNAAAEVSGMARVAVCEPMCGTRSAVDVEDLGRAPPNEEDDGDDACGTVTVLMTRVCRKSAGSIRGGTTGTGSEGSMHMTTGDPMSGAKNDAGEDEYPADGDLGFGCADGDIGADREAECSRCCGLGSWCCCLCTTSAC